MTTAGQNYRKGFTIGFMVLTDQDIERYKKHLQLKEVGSAGQLKLKQASVLVVGAGGLGSPVLTYLTGAGVGHIGIIDSDRLELSNLPRQVLHETPSLDQLKVQSAHERLSRLNPDVMFDLHAERFSPENARDLVINRQVVVDCTDNLETRLLLNEVCAEQGIPLVYGAVFEFEGQVAVFDAKRGPCLRCMIPENPPPGAVPDPATHGLLNTIPGLIGMMQATEVLKLLLGIGEPLIGKLMLFDALSVKLQQVRLSKRADCPVCGKYYTPDKR